MMVVVFIKVQKIVPQMRCRNNTIINVKCRSPEHCREHVPLRLTDSIGRTL